MKTVLLGCGGHARVLIETHAPHCFDGILDPSTSTPEVCGIEVLGGDELLESLPATGFTHFVVALGSVGDCSARAQLFQRALAAGLKPLSVISEAAIISPSACLGPGCQVMPRALVHVGAQLEANVLVNSGAIVEHQCEIGAHTHVATAAVLCGAVRIGRCVHIGAGAVIRQGICVGDGALIAAGAVVVRDVPSGCAVAGVPARLLKKPSSGDKPDFTAGKCIAQLKSCNKTQA